MPYKLPRKKNCARDPLACHFIPHHSHPHCPRKRTLSTFSIKKMATATTTMAQPPAPGRVRIQIHFNAQCATFDQQPTRALGAAMARFAQQFHYELALLRFTYNGQRVQADDTPLSLEMEESDVLGGQNVIDVHLEQTGGGSKE
ncbi:hypothetical protein C8R46DRAFT_1120839 [Mycena filopes]|nr:hypothetical protein C8R46DRAFT_1120839 [Mycena filopes]